MLVMEKYKLIQVGYPNEHTNWFDGVSASNFEDSVFASKAEAEAAVDRMCVEAGTNTDSNFSEFKPVVVTLAEFNARFGDEADNVFYW